MNRFSSRIKVIALLISTCVSAGGQSITPQPSELIPTAPPALNSNESGQQRRLTLQSATDLLIANNLVVVAARYNVDILRAQRIAAGLRPHPNLTFSATQFTIPRVLQNPSEFFTTNKENGAANSTYTLE